MSKRHGDLDQDQIDRIWYDTLMTGDFEHARRERRFHMCSPENRAVSTAAHRFTGSVDSFFEW